MEPLEDKLLEKITNLKLDDKLKGDNSCVFIVDKESQTLNVYDTSNQSFCFNTKCSTGRNLVDKPAPYSTPSGVYKIFRMDKIQDLIDNRDNTHPFDSFLDDCAEDFGPFCLMYKSKHHGGAIHGTNEPEGLGKPVSGGCVRMSNDDITNVLENYARVGTYVLILN